MALMRASLSKDRFLLWMLVAWLALPCPLSGDDGQSTAGTPNQDGNRIAGVDYQDVVLFAPEHPVFLRLRLSVDGRNLHQFRQQYIEGLFQSLDKNDNGWLDEPEAEKIPVLGEFEYRTKTPHERWLQIDTNPTDQRVSTTELAAYVGTQMGSPFLITARQLRASRTIRMFSRLDRNSDGKLTRQEMQAIGVTLSEFDIDDDETVSVAELQPIRAPTPRELVFEPTATAAGLPFAAVGTESSRNRVVTELIRLYAVQTEGEQHGHIPFAKLGLDRDAFDTFDANSDGGLDSEELAALMKDPVPHRELSVQLPHVTRQRPTLARIDQTPSTEAKPRRRRANRLEMTVAAVKLTLTGKRAAVTAQHNRQFHKLRFRIADRDRNGYLDEGEYSELGTLDVGFDAVDRDEDGKVFENELLASADEDAPIARNRIVMAVVKQGKSLFEMLDTDEDHRLSPREFQGAVKQLLELDRNNDSVLLPAEMAEHYSIVFEVGRPQLFDIPRSRDRRGTSSSNPRDQGAAIKWYRRMDRNRDGDVSWYEFLGSRELFDRLDTNRDGLIDADEAGRAD